MPASETSKLPSDWNVSEIAGHGVDLRLTAPLRSRAAAVIVIAILAILAGWKTLVQWNILSREAITPWVGLSLFLSALALWLIFGDEVWHLEGNCLVHRVGVGSWCYSRSYQDADLEITLRFSTTWNVPYYRLYAVIKGKPYFLIERSEPDLRKLANFISFHTGWQVRPQTISPG